MTPRVTSTTVREPVVAGAFYPASARRLQEDVDAMLRRAPTSERTGGIVGLVSPHAGYMYSGLTAAHAYGLLRERTFDAVVVIGPSHQEYFQGCSVYPGESYRTPLGVVPIHKEIRSALAQEEKRIFLSVAGHRGEHSVEVQLPFLQRVLGEFAFVPIVMGDQTLELCENLAEAIASSVGNRTVLLVASSDLSHYHPYEEATSLDRRVIDLVEEYDPLKLMDNLEHRSLEACGGGPIVSVMLATKKLGANIARVVHYCNSGDVTGEKGAVVGYCSAVFSRESTDAPPRVN